MQTTHPNDDMYADFFQVGGYRNFSTLTADMMSGGGSGSIKKSFTELAQRGRFDTSFLGLSFVPFTRAYDKIRQDYNIDDERINELWKEHRSQNGKVSNFQDYIKAVEYSNNLVEQQTINEQNTLPQVESIDISDVDFEEKKSGVPFVYVGIGAVLLVGITILLVKK